MRLGISDAELSYLIDRAGDGRMWGMRTLAETFNLTEADRLRLRITTISAIDMTSKQRKNLKVRAKRRAKLNAAALGKPALAVNEDA